MSKDESSWCVCVCVWSFKKYNEQLPSSSPTMHEELTHTSTTIKTLRREDEREGEINIYAYICCSFI